MLEFIKVMNSNIFFINLNHDIGRRKSIKSLCNKLDGQLWNGVDMKEYDKNKILIKKVRADL